MVDSPGAPFEHAVTKERPESTRGVGNFSRLTFAEISHALINGHLSGQLVTRIPSELCLAIQIFPLDGTRFIDQECLKYSTPPTRIW